MKDLGFTLIELMVVIVVIGILAAIAIPNYYSMQERARQAGVKEDMHVVQTSVEAFAVDFGGTYPSDVNTPGQGFGYYFSGGDADGQSQLGQFPPHLYRGGSMVVGDFIIFNYGASGQNSNNSIPGPNYANLGGSGFIRYGRWSPGGGSPYLEYGIVGSQRDGWTIKQGKSVLVFHN